jgi:hypothetical protein
VFVSLNVVNCNSNPPGLQSGDRKRSRLKIKESLNRTYLYFAFYDFLCPLWLLLLLNACRVMYVCTYYVGPMYVCTELLGNLNFVVVVNFH